MYKWGRFFYYYLRYTVYCLYFILCVYNNSIEQIKFSFLYVSIIKTDSYDDKDNVLNEKPWNNGSILA